MSSSNVPNSNPVRGVFAAAITPPRERSCFVDLGAAMEVIDFLSHSPVQGIMLLGSTGGFLHYDVEEREKLITFAIKRSRKPIVVNVSHSTLDVAVHLAEHAAGAGAAAAAVLPPYYFRYSSEQVEEYLLRAGEKCARTLPLYLYNLPFFTAPIALDSARRLLATGYFAGIKDSSGDVSYLRGLQDLGKTLMVGNDAAFAALRKDTAAGVVSGCAAAVPELLAGLERSIVEGNGVKEAQLSQRLNEFIYWLDYFPVPMGIEEACRMRKLPGRPNISYLGETARAKLVEYRAWFPGWLAEVLPETKW